MSYFHNKIVEGDFDATIEKVTAALKEQGFGVLTQIDIKSTFKEKLDVDFRKYRILGACNPNFAHKALLAEDKIGTMLPCNVIVQEHELGKVEVAAVNPIASMISIGNDSLEAIATDVNDRLKLVVEGL